MWATFHPPMTWFPWNIDSGSWILMDRLWNDPFLQRGEEIFPKTDLSSSKSNHHLFLMVVDFQGVVDELQKGETVFTTLSVGSWFFFQIHQVTPWKINMDPENDGLVRMFFLYTWVILRFHVNLPGKNHLQECWPLTIPGTTCWSLKKWYSTTVDGSEIPNNHLGCIQLCK